MGLGECGVLGNRVWGLGEFSVSGFKGLGFRGV